MPPDLWSLYELMYKSRLFEEVVAQLWKDGLVYGEMHLGTGEEAIAAGVVAQLREGDAMALDHRGSAPLLMRGVDPLLILRELLGHSDGLCGGKGGHMHLFSRDHLTASSGIVGAAGPAACGFALSAQQLRPGAVAAAFFGDGAVNQGMLMEALNLASAWKLPVVFVCKDDGWAITTRSSQVTGGKLSERVRGLGVPYLEVDGLEVEEVWEAAHQAIERARCGQGATFLHARCVHLEGHFLGFQLLRVTRSPLKELPGIMLPLIRSILHLKGALPVERLEGLNIINASLLETMRDPRRNPENDPLYRTRTVLRSDPVRLRQLEDSITQEINQALSAALLEDAA